MHIPNSRKSGIPEVRGLAQLHAELEADMASVRTWETRIKALDDFIAMLSGFDFDKSNCPAGTFQVQLSRISNWDGMSPDYMESASAGPFELTPDARDGLTEFARRRREDGLAEIRRIEAKYRDYIPQAE